VILVVLGAHKVSDSAPFAPVTVIGVALYGEFDAVDRNPWAAINAAPNCAAVDPGDSTELVLIPIYRKINLPPHPPAGHVHTNLTTS
jgi:hypothetical protein